MNNTLKVHIDTFGCQMNKLDSELVLGEMLRNGFHKATSREDADVILLNTCSVRRRAEEKVYSRLGSLKSSKQQRPQLIIGVIGCMAQNEKDRIFEKARHVDLVCGTSEIANLPDIVRDLSNSREQTLCVEEGEVHFGPRVPANRARRHQAFVSIMRGCDNFCSYCIVPHVRGREKSRPVKDIVAECVSLADDGVKEITLLGQVVDSYGKSLKDGTTLASLLEAVHQVDGLLRIRFVTSHPRHVSNELIDTMASLPKVCHHIHMPAQSGSDRILKAMHRGYTSDQYREVVNKARQMMPDLQIGGDFIVGFPSETDKDFRETERLLDEVRFQNCFIFKYSPRPGTHAAELEDDVPIEEKKARNQKLLSLQENISRERNRSFVGKTVEVLVDGPSKTKPNRLSGRTAGNDIVVFDGDVEMTGCLVSVMITDTTPLTLFGNTV